MIYNKREMKIEDFPNHRGKLARPQNLLDFDGTQKLKFLMNRWRRVISRRAISRGDTND